jgi:hypothetical protein
MGWSHSQGIPLLPARAALPQKKVKVEAQVER